MTNPTSTTTPEPERRPIPDMSRFLRRGLRPTSQAALNSALQLLDVAGVAGTLVVHLPEDNNRPVEMALTVGRVEVIYR